jgi:WD40 repeat protein
VNPKAYKIYRATGAPAHTLALSPRGDQAVAISLDWRGAGLHHNVQIWNLETDARAAISIPHERASSLVLAHDHSRLIAKHAYGNTEFLSLLSGRTLGSPPWPLALSLDSSAHVGNGDQLVGAIAPGVLARLGPHGIVWQSAAITYKAPFSVHFATPSRLVIASKLRNSLSVLDAETGVEVARHSTLVNVEGMLVAPGGLRALSPSKDKARYVSVLSGKTLRRPLLPRGVASYAFSPDGAFLALASNGTVSILADDLKTCAITFATSSSEPRVAWAPDASALGVVDGNTGALAMWRTCDLLGDRTIQSAPEQTLDDAL